MTSLTRFLKSGQLVHLLGNPAVANPPTKIKVPPKVADYPTLESWSKFTKQIDTRDNNNIQNSTNISSNPSTVVNYITNPTNDLEKMQNMAANTKKLAEAGAFDAP